jgi:hypothetical protein
VTGGGGEEEEWPDLDISCTLHVGKTVPHLCMLKIEKSRSGMFITDQ